MAESPSACCQPDGSASEVRRPLTWKACRRCDRKAMVGLGTMSLAEDGAG